MENNIQQLPIEFTFVDVMDFFFKAHKVFNLPHNPKMKAFMLFFEYYVYNHSSAKRLLPQKYESVGIEMTDMAKSSNNQPDAAKDDGSTGVSGA